jgi:hypothetical protein
MEPRKSNIPGADGVDVPEGNTDERVRRVLSRPGVV